MILTSNLKFLLSPVQCSSCALVSLSPSCPRCGEESDTTAALLVSNEAGSAYPQPAIEGDPDRVMLRGHTYIINEFGDSPELVLVVQTEADGSAIVALEDGSLRTIEIAYNTITRVD